VRICVRRNVAQMGEDLDPSRTVTGAEEERVRIPPEEEPERTTGEEIDAGSGR